MLYLDQFKDKYGISITTNHNDKMKGLASLSTSPLCNELCEKRTHDPAMICSHCYSQTMNKRFKNLREMLIRNSEKLTTEIIPVSDLPYLFSETGMFRLESFGDLINEIQVVNYFNICKYNPHMRCALWTKNPWIIERAIAKYGLEKPSNLTIIGSSYYINQPMVKGFKRYEFVDYIFTVYDKQFAIDNNIEIGCGGRSCRDCRKCYDRTHPSYEINELLK